MGTTSCCSYLECYAKQMHVSLEEIKEMIDEASDESGRVSLVNFIRMSELTQWY